MRPCVYRLPTISLLVVLGFCLPAPSGATEPAHAKKHAKRKRVFRPEGSPPLELAAPGNVPPGAQLTPNRVIDAPLAPGPNDSPSQRVEVPAREVTKKRDRDPDRVQPPYPTGPDPGRNMQPATGFSPSSQPIVP